MFAVRMVRNTYMNYNNGKKNPTRCNNNNLLIISISPTCFGR